MRYCLSTQTRECLFKISDKWIENVKFEDPLFLCARKIRFSGKRSKFTSIDKKSYKVQQVNMV